LPHPRPSRTWWNRGVTPTLVRTARLSPDQQSAVLALVRAAQDADGVAPMSEQSLLAARGRSGRPVEHLLSYAGEELAGYLQIDEGMERLSAELVVAPGCRRQGVGSQLLARVPAGARVWAHGDLPAAEGFANARAMRVTRELFVLGRRFDEAGPLPEAVLPEGLVARPFRPGRDEAEWLRVNAAAFAHHAEQGRMTRDDLDARMAESWFDPAGLILVVSAGDPDTVAAFHWTKRRSESEGEVYVVGVDPAYQGRGLGKPVTLLGLEHLRDEGVLDVILYVDGDNLAALKVYRGLGFRTRSVDRMYAIAGDDVDAGSPSGGTMSS
jgi:mycothiol synthase